MDKINNKIRTEIFKDTLEKSKIFTLPNPSRIYKDIEDVNRDIEIIWEYENTVNRIFDFKEKRVAALNFADGYDRGGLVWEGVNTQEEDLCRCSNLYPALELVNYPIDGKLVYTDSVVFFKDGSYKLREPVICDIITCPSPIAPSEPAEVKRRMRMIINSAKLRKRDYLILGKWGCGAFRNNWNEFKDMWEEVLDKKE